MNVEEAGMILGLCAAYDNRIPNEATMEAWADALYDVRYPDAQQAVKEHYRTTRQWAMPSDIRNIAVLIANDRASRQRAEQLKQLEAAHPKRPTHRLVEILADALQWTPERTAEERQRRDALAIRCPVEWCHAQPGAGCKTGHGRPTSAPHPTRVDDAKAAA